MALRCPALLLPGLLAACSAQPAASDPDLGDEAEIEAEAESLDEAADEAVRILEEDTAQSIEDHQAEAAAAAAAIYAGQDAQADGSGRQQPGDRQP